MTRINVKDNDGPLPFKNSGYIPGSSIILLKTFLKMYFTLFAGYTGWPS